MGQGHGEVHNDTEVLEDGCGGHMDFNPFLSQAHHHELAHL